MLFCPERHDGRGADYMRLSLVALPSLCDVYGSRPGPANYERHTLRGLSFARVDAIHSAIDQRSRCRQSARNASLIYLAVISAFSAERLLQVAWALRLLIDIGEREFEVRLAKVRCCFRAETLCKSIGLRGTFIADLISALAFLFCTSHKAPECTHSYTG